MDDTERLVAIGLAAGRIAIGAGIWLAPGLAGRALGFERLDGAALALGRIAATRDLILGGWQLGSLGDREQLRRATTAVALADAGDTLTFALARNTEAGRRGLAGAAPAALAGLWLRQRLG